VDTIHHGQTDGQSDTGITILPRVFNAPAELGIGAGSEETRMMRLPDGRNSFKIGFVILIQYRRVTDTQPSCRSRYRAYYVARVKIRQLLRNFVFQTLYRGSAPRPSWETPVPRPL